ncbi:MAG: citrate lyase acyl carrier protein [Deltaproteobacteria bacterium]|nr:citrate lyase acyl carrier protein [Deltaproteobacteria bacterium]
MARQATRIRRESKAGLDEKGDIVVCLSPGKKNSGIEMEIESTVKSLFGEQIRASIREIIEEYGIADLKIAVRDQGALDYAIRARVQTAIERALKECE